MFNEADVLIGEGQGNYEALSGVERPISFLLQAECHVVAEDLEVEEGKLVLKGMNLG